MTTNAETRDDDYPQGNLHRDYPIEFLEMWDGCHKRDCLPGCAARLGHCERLKREFEIWQSWQQRFADVRSGNR